MIRNKAVAFLTVLALTAPSYAVEQAPSAHSLLTAVLSNPTQAYEGQMLVSYWSETGSRAEDVRIFFAPPNNYRFEFLAPNGAVDRVVKSNGANEQLEVKNDRSYSTTNPARVLTPQEENELLIKNYKATIKPSEKVIDRATWAIELEPLVDGKPHQLIRIDRATRVILEIKRYSSDGKTGSLTRFTKFSPASHLSNAPFVSDAGFEVKKDFDQSNDPNAPPTDVALLPTTLHGGFSMQTRNNFQVNGKSVRHARYTDGLMPVSIFQTPLPVKAPQTQQLIPWNRPLEIGATGTGNVYQWKKDEAYFILIGDLRQDLLQQIAGHLK